MLEIIDTFLDGITMYRLVLYELLILLGVAVILSFFNLVPYTGISIVETTVFLFVVSYITNVVFSYIFKAPTNIESFFITALILALIAQPIHSYHDLPFLGWLAVWAMASKYIFAIKKKHIFNPVAVSAVICSLFLGQSVNWWVGTTWLAPFVAICGFLIVRKIQRETLVYTFFLSALITISITTLLRGGSIATALTTTIFTSSLLFFGFVMLTEPLTTPPTRNLRIIYAVATGILFSPELHFGSLYLTPEIALVIANIYSYIVSPKQKLMLTLKEKLQVGLDQVDYIFTPSERLQFIPGQYLEWTLPHNKADSRGNRRYFTIASSPAEAEIHLGVKFYPSGSSFKKALLAFNDHEVIAAGQLTGDFTMPKDKTKKLVFLAGGIGITPYRSMIKHLLDTKDKRDIILFYSNKIVSEIMYKDIFDNAKDAGVRMIYTLTDIEHIPSGWNGYKGRITPEIIKKEMTDYTERTFYLSGPHGMVVGFENVLKQMGIPGNHIKKDFFPGFV